MKRLFSIFLSMLLIGSFAGCDKLKADGSTSAPPKVPVPEKPNVSQSKGDVQESRPAPESSLVGGETAAGSETEDPLIFADEGELQEILQGVWTYASPYTGDDQVELHFSGDGNYYMEFETSGGDFLYTYNGSYEIDSWTGESIDPPDMILFTLEETTDENFLEDLPLSLGDYVISQKTLCDGEIMLQLGQANNGDGFFSLQFGDYYPVLRRSIDWQPQGETEKDAEFFASVWKVDHESRTVWLDTTSLDGIFVNEDRHEALPYPVADGVDLYDPYPFGNALAPGETCTVVTDTEGVVQVLEPFYSRKAMMSEEEVFSVLADYDEVQGYLQQGMTMQMDGSTEEIEGVTCQLVLLGTDDGELFTPEHLYAVSDLGSAYWYDTTNEVWALLAFG